MIAAIYARYSSDNQREESIEDQVRVCKDYAAKNKLEVVDQYVFSDKAQSGTLENRAQLNALREVCKSGEVQAVIVDDSSRLSRDTRHFFELLGEFDAYGVAFIGVADGLNTLDENAKVAFQFRGIFNEMYISDLSKKTRRGQEGQFHRGFFPSSIAYGYKLVKKGKLLADNSGRIRGEGSLAEIIPDEERNIVRIFTEFANGKAISAIVKDLNREKVPTRKGRQWNGSTVSKILENDIYIGTYTWGEYRTVKDPKTRKKKRVRNTRKPVLTRQDPSLRIISDELWQKVQAQRKKKENMQPSKRGSKGFGKKQIS
jgi:DNA invertase Pin-like site-specific DNA recombinase